MKRSDRSPRQYREHRAQQAFQRNLGKIWLGLRTGVPRWHLDVLVELCEALLPACGSSLLTNSHRAELEVAKRQVSTTPHLRLVK